MLTTKKMQELIEDCIRYAPFMYGQQGEVELVYYHDDINHPDNHNMMSWEIRPTISSPELKITKFRHDIDTTGYEDKELPKQMSLNSVLMTLISYAVFGSLNLKKQQDESQISLLRDCVSETWGAKNFNDAQELFDKFLKSRNLK